jgi:protein-disulfide isomerase
MEPKVERVRQSFLSRVQPALDALATIAIIAVSGTVAWSIASNRRDLAPRPTTPAVRPQLVPPKEPLSLEGANAEGNPQAKIAIIEYSDFQCPFCGAFARDTLPTLRERYIRHGDVLLAFRHLPLPMHPFARKAAVTAECAGQQKKFWPVHDLLFQRQQQLNEDEIDAVVKISGIDERQLADCIRSDATAKVASDATSAASLGVNGTPTFLVGQVQSDGRVKVSQILSGAQPIDQFERALSQIRH